MRYEQRTRMKEIFYDFIDIILLWNTSLDLSSLADIHWSKKWW